MRKLSWSLLVAGVVVVAGARARAEESPAQVVRAHRAIQANATDIMSWVYPTVKFDEIAGCEWAPATAGFTLACQFNYVDAGDHDARVLRFRLNAHGMITGIEDGGGDSMFAPFWVLRATKGLAAEMAQRELAQSSAKLDADQRALLKLLSRSPEPEEILAFLLNVQIAFN